MQLSALITTEHVEDVAFWSVFFLGQLVHDFKRAAAAVRSRHNPTTTRWDYYKQNFDILGLRKVYGFPIYWVFRHYSLAQLAMLVGWNVPELFANAGTSPFAMFFLGVGADSLIDWFSVTDLTQKVSKIPAFGAAILALQSWVREEVPVITETYSEKSKSVSIDEQTGAVTEVKKTIDVATTKVVTSTTPPNDDK